MFIDAIVELEEVERLLKRYLYNTDAMDTDDVEDALRRVTQLIEGSK